ncbi:MAG: hypothetical protein AAB458_01355 [Patescibacteria group bacterium]
MHSPAIMEPLTLLEPFDVVEEQMGPCNCGHDALGEGDPRGGHASSCPTQYAIISFDGHRLIVYAPNIIITEEKEIA